MIKKTVDIIIPTYKIPAGFPELLAGLSRQSYPYGRMIIMHTLPEEETLPVFPDVRNCEVYPVRPEEFDHGGTRDKALRLSSADLVLFLTQDAVPADEFLVEHLVKAFEDEKTAVAYGRQLAASDASEIEKFTRIFNYPEESCVKEEKDTERLGIKTYFCSDVCAMYDRERYLALGGFITKTIFNEDMIFAHKAITSGYRVAYCADAKVIHSHNYTGWQQLRRNFDMGVSQADHPEVFLSVSSSKEGASMVKETAKHLIRIHRPLQVFRLIYMSGMKYTGYQLGKHYKKLPQAWIRKLTTNKYYWRN